MTNLTEESYIKKLPKFCIADTLRFFENRTKLMRIFLLSQITIRLNLSVIFLTSKIYLILHMRELKGINLDVYYLLN